jgi:hypothetical protein
MDLLPIKFRHQTFQKEDNLTDLLVQKTNVSVHLKHNTRYIEYVTVEGL